MANYVDHNARILIVDDEPMNVALLQAILRGDGFTQVIATTDARTVLPLFLEQPPDLLMLDLMMPHLNGFQIMEQVQAVIPDSSYFPILVLTADSTRATKQRALECGAMDFLTKPLDMTEVLLRTKNLLHTRALHVHLADQNARLDGQVRERARALEIAHRNLDEAQLEVLDRLAQAAEYRDDDTGQHTRRVGGLSAQVAQALGWAADDVALIRRAAPLHDVGKIGISDRILLKPGKLTEDEFAIMQTHTTIGAALLAGGHSALVQMAYNIALSHHERWDGSGYPQRLAGDDIPLAARIVSVVDVFDALTHERPYKSAWPVEEAVAEIRRLAGQQFDPRVGAAFLAVIQRPRSSPADTTASLAPAAHLPLFRLAPPDGARLRR